MKNYFRVLIYISIPFIIYYLYKNNLFSIPNFNSSNCFLFSLFFLFLGFLLDVLTWHITVNSYIFKVIIKDSIISYGIYIFSKYIPGKLWMIIGKAEYISKKYNQPIAISGTLSFLHQLIVILSGAILSSIALVYISSQELSYLKFLIPSIILIAFLFGFNYIINYTTQFVNLFLKKKIEKFRVRDKSLLLATLLSLSIWVSWGIGFFLFAQSISPISISLMISFIFPIATVAGILAIVVPGGIGIREGILGIFIYKFIGAHQLASTISIFSRLWFLIGEVFIFILAFVLYFLMKSKKR